MHTKSLIAAAFLTVSLAATNARTDVTQNDIDQALHSGLSHPYLHFTEKEKPAILDRIEHDGDAGDIFRKELAEANRLIYTPIDRDAPERHTNARYEADYGYEAFLMKNARSAHTLAFVYQMTGDERYARKAFEFADVVCDQPTWIHSVHEFPDIYDRVWPWGAKDDQAAFGYSQHTDHYVFMMAAVYDWLYPVLSRKERDRIRGALLEKAILRVRGNYEYHWWAAAYKCNWCAVCNSSLGVAAITLLTEDPQLTDVVAESWNRISRTLDEVGSGGWQEGMGYLAYTVRTSLAFADVLKRVTGGKLNLYEHPRFDDAVNTILYCGIPPNKAVHFGDSGGGSVGSYLMLNELMLERKNPVAAWLREAGGYKPAAIADIFKPENSLDPAIPNVPSILFPSVNWVIMRSDFDNPENVVIAAKCGMNDDPHHGHLDAGHFSLYWRGCEFICDHGSAGYDKAYFDEARWTYPLAATIGHNCVMVNGEQQRCCKLKNKPWDLRYGGEIIDFKPDSKRDYVLMDPTNAYPCDELRRWRRHIVLDKPDITLVVDEVSCSAGAEIEVRFHSAAKQSVGEGSVLLTNDSDRMALIPFADSRFEIRENHHEILLAQRNARRRVVPYVGTIVRAEKERTVIGAILLPVKDATEATEIAESVKRTTKQDGDFSVSFTSNGKTNDYSFVMGDGGLVLK